MIRKYSVMIVLNIIWLVLTVYARIQYTDAISLNIGIACGVGMLIELIKLCITR